MKRRALPWLLCGLAALAAAPLQAASNERPNILLIVADDLGYSDLGSFGGEIETPVLDGLATTGLQLTQMYAAPSCSPTRAMLLSGTDNHLAGLGTMAEALPHMPFLQGKPGYEGFLNGRSLSIAELLRDGGYRTSMVGKWHLGLEPNQGPAARGFQQSFAMLEGGAVHFQPDSESPTKLDLMPYRENGEPVTLPEDFYSSNFYTDKLIEYLRDGEGSGKPFFAYAAYTAPHWPLQAPDSYIDTYRGRYDEGYESVRAARIERMKSLGLIPSDFDAAMPIPANPKLSSWDQLTSEQQAYEARKMEIYAAMVDNLDDNIGRLFDYLRESGQYDNTLVVFLSDNGAAAEDHGYYYPAGPKTDNSLDNLGRRHSQIDYGVRWAEVSATPFRLFKGTTAEGGISVPSIVKLPASMARSGMVRGAARVDDLAPTFLELAGIKNPGNSYGGRPKNPITGHSMLPMLRNDVPDTDTDSVLAGELFGNLYYREGDLKLLGMRPWTGFGPSREPVRWQLFDLSRDRGEQHDLAVSQPETLERLRNAWKDYADRVGVARPPQKAPGS